MSPPIFTPDGSEVSVIVLPDGETAREVVAPDGTVVFEPAIPDSAIHQHRMDQGSGSTVADSIGSFDATLNNTNIRSSETDLVGGFGLDFGQANDGDFASTGSFPSSIIDPERNESWGVALTIKNPSHTSGNYINASTATGDDIRLVITTETTNTFLADCVNRSVDDRDVLVINESFSQFDKLRVFLLVPSDTNVPRVFWNNTEKSLDIRDLDIGSFTVKGTGDYRYGSFGNSSSSLDTGILDNGIIYNGGIDTQTVAQDFNLQPWS
jgi:hypothetical protein